MLGSVATRGARQAALKAGLTSSSSTSQTSPILALKPVYAALSPSLHLPSKVALADVHEQLVALDPTVFDEPLRRDILHLCVNYYRDGLRQGSANTKSRSDIVTSGRKLRPQKGTGKARLGDASSPMLRGGAVAFGPKPRDFRTQLNKKVRQMGMRVALSARLHESKLGLMRELAFPQAKTNYLANKLDEYGLRKTLLVTGARVPCEGLVRASKVLKLAGVCSYMQAEDVDVYHLLHWPRVVLDLDAVRFFEANLRKREFQVEYP